MPRAKKFLGQHFLTSSAIAARIAEEGDLAPPDKVFEIGPGKGILTRELLKRAGHVVAVEKDENLAGKLVKLFQPEISRGRLDIVEGDALTVPLASLRLERGSYKLIANIPYYITGEIIRHFLTSEIHPSQMVILVQKEVAKRIATSSKESVLSLSVKVFGTPHYAGTVSARYFSPKPKVDSAILSIKSISRAAFRNREEEERFFKILKCGFSKKRKKLSGNLKEWFTREELMRLFKELSIDERARAEDVPLRVWLAIARSQTRA